MIKYFAAILLFLIQFSLFSQTNVDALNVNGKWTKAESPYLINTDIAVSSNDTLIIEAGVHIIFLDYYLFQVFGYFSAIGNENDSIYFTVVDTTGYYNGSHTGWGGLDLASNIDTVELNYCVIEYSQSSGIFCTEGNGFTLSNSCIRYNDYDGVAISNVQIYLNQVKIYNNKSIGIHDYYGSYYTLSDFEISNNGGRGISTSNYSGDTIYNGIIKNNIGGGISVGYESWPHIHNIVIEGNGNPDIDGGGIVAYGGCNLENLTIQNNKANNGGGIASLIFGFEDMQLFNSAIKDNIAINEGGGIYHNGETLNLSNIQIANNLANNGGGIAIEPAITEMSLVSSLIKDNMAFQDGGGIYINGLYSAICAIQNVEVSSNQAGFNGGGIYNSSFYNFEIDCENLTVVSNFAGYSGGGLYCAITDDTINYKNSIFWNNTPDEIIDTSGLLKITYSNIEGGYTGYGNINSDPLFIDPINGDYRLSWLNYPLDDDTKSPCIGAGSEGTHMGTFAFDNSAYELYMPVINSIVDVPNDQGKQVVINWTRSILDATGGSIDKYTIWRKQNWAKEPWEYLGFTPAQYFEEYAFIAPTVSDSSAIGIPHFTYLISAVDADSNLYYYSYPDSGYSVDNIAPYPPQGFQALLENDTVFLSWNNNLEEDFDYYALYKNIEPGNFPDDPYITTNDSLIADFDISNDTLYYFITAFDKNGNESFNTGIVEIIVGTVLDLKVFLEGPYFVSAMIPYLNFSGDIPLAQPYIQPPWNYNGEESIEEITNSNIVDWLLLEFRDAPSADSATSETMIGRQAVFVSNNGNIVGLDGISKPRCNLEYDLNLYLVIWHRNHLGVMTSIPLEEVDEVFLFDFTSDPENIFGGINSLNNLGQDIWGMIAADGNADNQVDNKDKNDIWINQKDSLGYLSGDFNMDSQVDLDDKIVMWQTNVGRGVIVSDSIFNSK